MPDPRPSLVLVDDVWLPDTILAWRRDAAGWRALVTYRAPLRRPMFVTAAIPPELADWRA